jgi:hypothetical protein
MTQSFGSFSILSIIGAILAGIAIVLLLIRILRKNTRDSARSLAGAKTPEQDEEHGERWVTIVDQLDFLERANKDQMQVMTADMVEANDWQALGQQFDSLLNRRLEHLKTLASRHNGSFTTEEALQHTLEAYRLSGLILTLYDQFVAESDVVTELLDEWLQEHRGTTTSQLGMMVNLDCARILLLNLDYACPSLETSLEQLNLAGEYWASACSPHEDEHSPCKVLLSEIALRKRRLSERSPAS